jgi:hypothetical protein
LLSAFKIKITIADIARKVKINHKKVDKYKLDLVFIRYLLRLTMAILKYQNRITRG